ncbi:alpha/beta fold hydrolase [Arhodomonas sp. AD133]|uniref:alpha/beta fold hydrolase n=1 Tax=Arhodomonas sp. AD133 TaxID=3415009 RepID=UPI003EBD6B4A
MTEDAADTATTSPAQVVSGFLDAFGSGDMDDACRWLDPAVAWHVDGAVTVPTVGFLRGRERVREWLRAFPRDIAPKAVTTDRILSDGDDVIVLGHFRHTAVATGNGFEGDFAMRFTVRGGMITRYQIFEDSLAVSRAFDPAAPAAPEPLRVNGTAYALHDQGDGPSMLFAHGLFVDHTLFDEQRRALRETHRCLGLDMPAHGVSGFRPEGWSLADVAADLALLIEERRLAPVTFVGHSQGGMVGLRLAAERPDLVDRLVLMGTSALAEPEERHGLWRSIRKALVDGDEAARAETWLDIERALRGSSSLTREAVAARRDRQRLAALDPSGLALAIDAATLERPDIRELLPHVRARTLVMVGAEDHATPPELAREIADRIGGARLEIVPGGDHHLPRSAPETVNERLAGFLAEA